MPLALYLIGGCVAALILMIQQDFAPHLLFGVTIGHTLFIKIPFIAGIYLLWKKAGRMDGTLGG